MASYPNFFPLDTTSQMFYHLPVVTKTLGYTYQNNSTQLGIVFSSWPFGKLLFIFQDIDTNVISS